MIRFFMHKMIPCAFVILFCLTVYNTLSFAETANDQPITITVPEETIRHFIKNLLPYEITMGENFTGALWVQTIDRLDIGTNHVVFFMKVLGKDIEFSTKIGKRILSLKFGEADVSCICEASLRYDKEKKTLFITPQVKEFVGAAQAGQAGEALKLLLKSLSNIEYAIDLHEIDPIQSELQNKLVAIHFDIFDIYSKNNELFVMIIPRVATDLKTKPDK
ncbi:MAG: hypothetical protein JW932_02085 [Deltaproteobacteria bacterium]|nr:hypothetical protein [Deltaproteobacteria bacterium]